MSIDHAALNASCFTAFGEAATYTPSGGSPVAITVIVDRNVDLAPGGFDSTVIERRTVLNILKTEVAAPERGDVCVVGATSYTVDSVFDDDGYVVKVAVR